MKEKFIKSASVFSKAIIQPVMFMAVTGIILSVCAIGHDANFHKKYWRFYI